METNLLFALYLATAFVTAAYVFLHGVVLRRRVRDFAMEEHAVLTLAALAVGAAWPLFVPGLAIAAWRAASRMTSRPWASSGLGAARTARARG